jgi:signal transduction histidine kinase
MSLSVDPRPRESFARLTALHRCTRQLQDGEHAIEDTLADWLTVLPTLWPWPEVSELGITWGELRWHTPGFGQSPWRRFEPFALRDGRQGGIEIAYRQPWPDSAEGPGRAEEQASMRALAEIVRACLQQRQDQTDLLASRVALEREVAERTTSLRRLARELGLAEERERRQIAEGLHDHLGQALAIIKLRLRRLRGDAVLGGHGGALGELVDLCDQAIRYTRELTFELSPPVLYELGLGPALSWLGDQIQAKHGLTVMVHQPSSRDLPEDVKVLLWKSARELLHNVVKHAAAKRVTLTLDTSDERVRLTVADDGLGFDPAGARHEAGEPFGLFSIEERLHQLGGHMAIESSVGGGTVVVLEASLAPRGGR